MAEPTPLRRFLTTTEAAAYFGVCAKTFRKMVRALPAARRPKQVQFPGVAVKRWRLDDLDTAFAAASASAGWDRKLEGGGHVKAARGRRVG